MSTEIESLELKITSDSKDAANGIEALTQTLTKLKGATKGSAGLSSTAQDMEKLSNATKKASMSFTDLYHKVKTVAQGVKKVGSVIYSAVEKSMDYTENMNLFKVSMGEYAADAIEDAENFRDLMGIDTSEWIRAQGIFMTMATGFGVAGDRAATMSKNLTQLGYDLASFYNMDVETAMLKLKSGLAGELEPLRAIGYDLSQAKLEATALELGIKKSVSAMTQAEKAQLRYYAIMTQVTDAQGDMARTLNDPANQMRMFKAEVTMAAREIGNIFIPALNAVLPYATALARVIGMLADTIATLSGFKESGIEEGTSKVVENTDAVLDNMEGAQEEAKKLKSYLLGFDELNVINPNAGEETSDASDMFDFELPEYDFMEQLADNKVADIVERMKEWLGLSGKIDSWWDLIATNFGNIVVSVGLIGIGLATWKISKLVKDVGKLKAAFAGVSIFFKAMGIAAVSMAAIAGAAWLISNTESIVTGIGAILSASALVVGSILAFTGINLPLGIALMAVGAVSMGAAIAMNTEALSNEVKNVLAVVFAALSGASLVVGAMLAFTGVNVPLGIALMAGGALTLATAIAPSWNSFSDEVQAVITTIMGAVGGAFLALGAILAFTGVNVPLGIGLMATGALSVGGAVALNWESMTGSVEGVIKTITDILGAAALGLGAVLAFTGANIPLGIGLMVIGATKLVASIALKTNALSKTVKGVIATITSAVSLAILAVGAILAFTGINIPLGIALMAGGAVTLGTAIIPNWHELSDSVQEVISILMVAVGGALLALGAILAFTGAGLPLGIGLMLVGAASLGTAIELNWSAISAPMQGAITLITAIVSAALLVLGAILAFSGAGLPLGIGLILIGAQGLAATKEMNWDAVSDKIKPVIATIMAILGGAMLVLGVLLCLSGVGIGLGLALIFGALKLTETAWKLDDNPIIEFVKNMANGIVNIMNKVIDCVNEMFHIQFGGLTIKGVEIIPSFDKRLINIPKIPLLAEGGFPDQGQMFIAREAGAEMVGSIGRRTAVANNDQIVAGIANGVAEANEEQNVLLREQNSLLRAILEKDSGTYLDGKNLTNSVEKYQRERGRVLITGGVL